MNYLCFKISGEEFCIDADIVRGIMEVPKITKMPAMPKYILGVMEFQGKPISVLDSRIRLNLIQKNVDKPIIFVIQLKEDFYGILVDEMIDMINLEEQDTTIENIFVSGMIKKSEEFVMILDPDKFINHV